MEELIEILHQFDDERKNRYGNNWNETAVAECFKPCAKGIFGGYFNIVSKDREYILDIGAIELYYHEEEGLIKDPVMYHTNDNGSYSKYYNKKEGLPFFNFGSFNLHTSGVDVTFECPKNKYRASFLIRSYRVLDSLDQLNDDSIDYDTCSTHIFDDMFPLGISLGSDAFKIEWKEKGKAWDYEQCKRVNVAEYMKDKDGRYIKENGNYIKEELVDFQDPKDIDKNQYFKSGNHYYKKESRLWGFQIIKKGI